MNEMEEKMDIEITKIKTLNNVLSFVNEGVKRAYNQNRDYLKEAILIAQGEINMIPERQHLRELYEYYEIVINRRAETEDEHKYD